jgi:metallo-beta-lactamase family protein
MDKRIMFLGASRNVTGSRTMVQAGKTRVLVDCGLHQERQFKDRDFKPFPVKPSSISAVVLTHAHLDHCGYLPKLYKEGFRGKVYCTPATAEVARIVMLDSAFLQEEDAKHKRKRHRRQKRKPTFGYEPLYTTEDAEKAAGLLKKVKLGTPFKIGKAVAGEFRNAGHILGSSSVRLVLGSNRPRSVLFSGDVGRPNKPIIRDPVQFNQADYVVMESTYGDRVHGDVEDIATAIAEVVNDTVARGGNLLIPSFAIERAHEVMYYLNQLMRQKRIPRLMTFLDSPMAQKVTKVFQRHPELFDDEMAALVREGHSPFAFPQLVLSRTADESKAINSIAGTVIVIAGSGMCVGGRIKHHLVQNIHRPESTVLFVGYQADGTLGRQILDGKSPVRILGMEHEVRARVVRISGFSAHADRDELVAWVKGLEKPPRRIYVTHGEGEAASALGAHIAETTGWDVQVPDYRNEYVIH